MKTKFPLLIIVLILSFSLQISAQDFSFTPQKPKPGDKITVKFRPLNPLQEEIIPELVVYLYNQDLRKTISLDLKADGDQWSGTFVTDKKDYGALAVVKAEDITYNNNKKGYVIPLYDKSGNLVPGNQAGLGYGYFNWAAYYLEFDRDPQTGYELMKKDFEKNPSIKTEFVEEYVPLFSTVDKPQMQGYLKEGVQLIEKKKSLTEDDYTTLSEYYHKLDDTVNASKYEKIAVEKFPKGTMVQMNKVREISQLSDINAKLIAVKEFGFKYPESDFLNGIHSPLIKIFLEKGDYAGLEKFLEENKNVVNSYYIQNSAIKITEKGGDLNTALSIASKGVAKAKIENQKDKQPEFLSDKQWEESKNQNLGQCLFVQGKIFYDLDKKSEAYASIKEAALKTNFQEPLINYYYAKLLVEREEFGEAFEKLSGFIASGNSTPEMTELLETSYLKVKGNSNGYSVLLSGLQKQANKKIEAKLQNEMINDPAPEFKLADLNGKEVTLSEFKGKVVVIDFWATWCGPCLSSFPGMKKAVEMFSDAQDVKFLFINTRERVEDKKKNASDFLIKNNYPFHVLLDLDSKVMENYKVAGIPTKFIIDKDGNIRFKSLGFSGNTEKMVAELQAMISMLRDQSSM